MIGAILIILIFVQLVLVEVAVAPMDIMKVVLVNEHLMVVKVAVEMLLLY